MTGVAVDPDRGPESVAIKLPHAHLTLIEMGDRLAHSLVSSFGARSSDLLRSVDLDPSEPGLGPTSPVFQESHVEQDSAGLRLMLVGQWAKVHFSAVVEHSTVRPDELRFGIAARVRQPSPVSLGSTYTLFASPVQIRTADPSMLEIDWPEQGLILRIEPLANARLALAEAGRSALRVQFTPASGDDPGVPDALPARTIQWDYVLRWMKPA